MIEAIESGKPWRYPGGGSTWWKLDLRVCLVPHPDVEQVHTGPQYRNILDLLGCKDFEIEETTVDIGKTKFWEAVESIQLTLRGMRGYEKVSLRDYFKEPEGSSNADVIERLAQALGIPDVTP